MDDEKRHSPIVMIECKCGKDFAVNTQRPKSIEMNRHPVDVTAADNIAWHCPFCNRLFTSGFVESHERSNVIRVESY